MLLDGMMRSGTLPHSLLLMGPGGAGKELMAMRLAARLNCTAGGDDAGERCSSCLKVARLEHPDLHLIYPVPSGGWEKSLPVVIESRREDFYGYGEFGNRARSIGIDSVRHVIEAVSKQPFEGRRSVVVFFEAHYMTLEAQNAALKLLEEPPPSTVLFLVTEHADRLIPTILSRCIEIRFDPLVSETVASFLNTFYSVEVAEARRLGLLADGNLRRGILLTEGRFQRIQNDAVALVRLLVDGKGKAMLAEAEALSERYTREEIGEILNELTVHLRLLLRQSSGAGTEIEQALLEEALGTACMAKAAGIDIPTGIRKIHRASESLGRNADLDLTLSQLLLDLVGKWY
ncbi:MAG: hypothetical protein JSV33_09805 [bacterium]|nr:MAG: hypothetical protein JSV33_09805 [bacterium]